MHIVGTFTLNTHSQKSILPPSSHIFHIFLIPPRRLQPSIMTAKNPANIIHTWKTSVHNTAFIPPCNNNNESGNQPGETNQINSPSKWLRNSLVTGSHTFHNDDEGHIICMVITLIVVEDSEAWSGWHGDNPITRNTSTANSRTATLFYPLYSNIPVSWTRTVKRSVKVASLSDHWPTCSILTSMVNVYAR